MAAPAPLYYIAGPADDEDFAKAEHLAEMIMSALPGNKCRVIPVLPEQWDQYGDKLCAKLGTTMRIPIIWTGNGKSVGGLFDFQQDVEVKYDIKLDPEIKPDTWKKIAQANLAALRLKVSGALPDLAPPGSGGARGAAISEAFMLGHERFLEGKSDIPYEAGGLAAAVLTLGPLPGPVYKMFDCPDTACVVVPCGAAGIDANGARAAEQLVFKGGCRALFIVGSQTAELAQGLSATAAQLAATDAPLSSDESAMIARMMPALARVLAVAPPRASEEERALLALEEWVREGQDSLFGESAALKELYERQGLHVTRCAYHGGKLHQL